MKQVGDGFFENEVQKYVSGTELRTTADRNDCAVRVPNIGMRFCVMRLTILLSLRAMELSRWGVKRDN